MSRACQDNSGNKKYCNSLCNDYNNIQERKSKPAKLEKRKADGEMTYKDMFDLIDEKKIGAWEVMTVTEVDAFFGKDDERFEDICKIVYEFVMEYDIYEVYKVVDCLQRGLEDGGITLDDSHLFEYLANNSNAM